MQIPVYYIPVVTAVAGFLAIFVAVKLLLRVVLPKKQAEIAAGLGKLVATQLFSFDAIRAKLSDPEKIKAIMPYVEEQLDHFLREKLPKAMPVLSMFIGDSTIGQIKGTLVAELNTLFPKIIDQYLQNAQKEFDMEVIVTRKVSEVSIPQIESALQQNMGKELGMLYLSGALIGLLTGALYLGIILLF